MQRRQQYSSRPQTPRRKRPTNRVIQAGNFSVAVSNQLTGYVFTATDPCTATNFKLDIGQFSGPQPVPYALVFIPDGYTANYVTYPSVPPVNFYEPSQNVLISGVLTSTGHEDEKFSRYSRKMATGDQIALLVRNLSLTTEIVCAFELSFTTVH